MARFDNLDSDYTDTLEPLAWISSFFEELYSSETRFGADDQREGSLRHATCYLDYLFVWLAEGDGALMLPTFEDWLLAIIRYADDLYSPRQTYGTGVLRGESLGTPNARQDTEMGLLDWGATSRDAELNRAYVDRNATSEGRSDKYAPVNRPADEEGMRHPALDRNVYQRCRERALARQQEEIVKNALRSASLEVNLGK